MAKPRKISISAVRRANDSLVRQNQTGRFLSENQSSGSMAIRLTYSGHSYEIDMSPSEIKDAYAESIKATSSKK